MFHRIWMVFDPRRALIGLFTFLLVLALTIHFILLSTARYDWLEQGMDNVALTSDMSPLPPGR
ncbi:MAG TPA: light-harvesting antenna LH1, alpha subunit [Longimicrobiaceae bacterium]|nr:light-harvesting antenna LH1, alpha subunit [Longimicrobiaceae bacterium]HLL46377.1 light-harvesting antenna LH1, alpha subunit [Longimicrobiaceae bacterium]